MELICLTSLAPNNPLGYQAKHCNYHRNQGHSTEECFKVKDLLEELVRSGALNRLIYRIENNRDRGTSRGRGKRRSGRGRSGRARSSRQVDTLKRSQARTTQHEMRESQHEPENREGHGVSIGYGEIKTIVDDFAMVVPPAQQGKGTSEVSVLLASYHHMTSPISSLQINQLGTINRMIQW